ncbi:MAG: STN domain-containing protein, partial [Methylobacter sp.]|nr:STN domain-containing protein [Methylobacter sp.]
MKKTGTPALATGKTTRRKHAHITRIALHLGLVTLTAPMMVQANEVVAPTTKADNRNYNITKQPLYSALSTLAEQAGIQFVYSAEMVKNLTSPGVQGQYTAEETLQKVLSGTGISFRRTGPNTVALEQNKSAKEPDATTLKPMTVVGTANPDNDPTAYKITNASTATKTD